jgi:MFS family permease
VTQIKPSNFFETSRFFPLVRDRDFRRVWVAAGAFGTMRWLEILSVGVFVFDLTKDPFQVAAITFVRLLPLILFGAFSGAIADRVNRKGLVVGGLIGLSMVSAVLGTLVLLDRIAVWHIAVGAFLHGLYWSTDFPARRTIMGEIAGPDRLSSAMGLDAATNMATRMLGPSLGGILLEMIGLQGTYFLGVFLYGLGGILASRIRYRQPSSTAIGRNVLIDVVEGLRFVRSRPTLVGVFFVTIVVNFFGFSYVSMVPVIGRDVLGVDAFLVGLLMSSEACGGLVGSMSITLFGSRGSPYRAYLMGAFAFLVAVLVFSLSRWFEFSLLVLFFAGLGFSRFAVSQGTIPFLAAPPELRSRVMGALTLGIGIGQFGMIYVGLLADWLGAPTAVLITAAEGLAALVVTAMIWPGLRERTGGEALAEPRTRAPAPKTDE